MTLVYWATYVLQRGLQLYVCHYKPNKKFNDPPSSDYFLKLKNMKLESLVIADQHAAVNMFFSFVHTARHVPKIGSLKAVGLLFLDLNFKLKADCVCEYSNWNEVVTR